MAAHDQRPSQEDTHADTRGNFFYFFNPFPVLLWLSVYYEAGKFECLKAIIHVNAANNFSQRLTLVFLTLAKCKVAF